MLASMQAYVQSHADVISQVTGIHVEIMDNNMVRIAGTGIYAAGVGESMSQAGEVYKEVMRTHKTILIESPRHHAICQNCPDLENCRERFSLATPIVSEKKLHGVIGLVCFNDADRQRVMDSLDSYTSFISFLADALVNKIKELEKLNRARQFLELMLQVVDVPGQGILLFDYNGELIYNNTPARDFFALKSESGLRLENIQRTGQKISDFEEFEVCSPNGQTFSVLGRLQELTTQILSAESKTTLFVFELPSRLAQLVGDLSAAGAGTGFENIIGSSPALTKLKEKARKIARSSSTVLIYGESGSGKELLARAIYQASPRRDSPFVPINCGGIPDTLLESELFGYVSGAFTGASSRGRMGKFELAQGGVIFLDEISSMPLHMQVKLLRVLQERVITRLGSNQNIHVDVRVIAASNENLQDCINRNAFREDLYYRLNVIPLTIPPLRERKGDIAILTDYFLNKYCVLFNKTKPRLRAALLRLLENYSWPGNIRELEHVLEYAVNMMPEDGQLTLDCLPGQLLESLHAPEQASLKSGVSESDRGKAVSEDLPLEPLRTLEERAIRAALERFGQSTEGKKKAAKALGLSLATLYRKMNGFSI